MGERLKYWIEKGLIEICRFIYMEFFCDRRERNEISLF